MERYNCSIQFPIHSKKCIICSVQVLYVSFAHCEETYFFRSLGWSSPLAGLYLMQLSPFFLLKIQLRPSLFNLHIAASSNTLSAISAPAENSAEPILRILQACLVFENAKAMESLHMQVSCFLATMI